MQRRYVFVDRRGGSLAVLAAGVATRCGLEAVAMTVGEVRATPDEVLAVLREIGASAPVATPYAPGEPGRLVQLGAAQDVVDGAEVWAASLFEPPAGFVPYRWGEDETAPRLEHLAFARIARDQLEERLRASDRAG